MRKGRSTGWIWLLLGFLLIVALLIYFTTRSERVKTFTDDLQRKRDDLRKRIQDKEGIIGYIMAEIDKLKAYNDELVARAIRFFQIMKILAMIVFAGICLIFYAFFHLNLFEALGAIVFVSSLFFNVLTILKNNKLGDINLTLQILKEYFIALEYKRNGFEPEMIRALELKLNYEREQLCLLKREYDELKMIK